MTTRSSSLSVWGLRLGCVALVVVSPTTAMAGWGDENWNELVWGRAATTIPALSGPALALLALALVSAACFVVRRSRRTAR